MENRKEIYARWNIPYNEEHEKIQLIITDTGYINYIDDKSIHFNGVYEEVLYFGDIILECSNISNKTKIITSLFDKYKRKYRVPTLDAIKEIYSDFRSINFSDLITRIIIDELLNRFILTSTFKTFRYDKYLSSLVYVNPIAHTIVNSFTLPGTARVEFEEDKQNHELQLYYSDFDIISIQNLDTIYARKNNVIFHKCTYCGGYFVEKNGNNKKFCPNCKNIHSDLKSDAFRNAYRTAYRTMRQRAKRYGNSEDDYFKYLKEYNEPFEDEAKNNLDAYRKRNDLAGYIKFLEELENKYKPAKERK